MRPRSENLNFSHKLQDRFGLCCGGAAFGEMLADRELDGTQEGGARARIRLNRSFRRRTARPSARVRSPPERDGGPHGPIPCARFVDGSAPHQGLSSILLAVPQGGERALQNRPRPSISASRGKANPPPRSSEDGAVSFRQRSAKRDHASQAPKRRRRSVPRDASTDRRPRRAAGELDPPFVPERPCAAPERPATEARSAPFTGRIGTEGVCGCLALGQSYPKTHSGARSSR